MKQYPLVKISWLDACNYTERNPLDYDFKAIPVETVGYLLKEDDKEIVLFRDVYEYGESDDQLRLDGVIVIPRGCIKNFYTFPVSTDP
jgi:hypothetical protein